MIRFYLFCFFILLNFFSFSQVELVKEFERVESFDKTSPENFVEFKGELYFVFDGGDGRSIWKMDSVSNNPIQFLNFNREFLNFDPVILGANSRYLFFSANSLEFGKEIWRSNGTIEGTEMVSDFAFGENSFDFTYPFIVSENEFIFLQKDSLSGYYLWKTKGENLGFELLFDTLSYDLKFNNQSKSFIRFEEFQNKIYFTNRNDSLVTELWGVNLNLDGVFKVQNSDSIMINYSNPASIFENHYILYKQNSNQFLKLNLSGDSLILFYTLNYPINSENIKVFNIDSKYFLKIIKGSGDTEFYLSDLTESGTNLLPGLTSKKITEFLKFNNGIYVNNQGVYKLDTTSFLLEPIYTPDLYGSNLFLVDNKLHYKYLSATDFNVYFSVIDSNENIDTTLVFDSEFPIQSYNTFSFASNIFNVGYLEEGYVFRKLNNQQWNNILRAKKNYNTKYQYTILTTKNYIYLAEKDQDFEGKTKFYFKNNKEKNFNYLGEIDAYLFNSFSKDLIINDVVIIKSYDNIYILDAKNNKFDSVVINYILDVKLINENLYVLSLIVPVKYGLFKVNLNTKEVLLIESFDDVVQGGIRLIGSRNNGFIQKTYDFSGNNSLWMIIESETTELSLIVSNSLFQYPNNEVYYSESCSCWFFSAKSNIDTIGYELWKSDGTIFGTHLVKDINVANNQISLVMNISSSPFNFFELNNNTYFFGKESTQTGYALYKTDGTSSGTQLIKSLSSNFNQSLFFLKEINGKILFNLNDSLDGFKLFETDGTFEGTNRINVFQQENMGVYEFDKAVFKNEIYFSAKTQENGAEIWTTDGTEAGTSIFYDLFPGEKGSLPYNLSETTNAIYFQARFAKDRWGIFKIDLTPPIQVDTPTIFPNPSSSLIQIVSPEEQSRIRIFDLTGKLVYDKVVSGTQNEVDISTYRAGLYIAQIESNGQFQSVRFIKL